jgi:hypothetical protein
MPTAAHEGIGHCPIAEEASQHNCHPIIADKGLILCGRARTYYAKQRAQHAVMEATGLPILANEIEVSCPDNDGR